MVSLPSIPTSFAPGGLPYGGLVLLAAVPAVLVTPFLGVFLLGAAAFVLYFYRDPDRHPPVAGVVAPADGRVSVIEWDGDARERIRVGIYLGPWDVHVVRSPFGGEVRRVHRESGGHWPAQLGRADRNEKLHVEYDGATVTLIVGMVARRIRPYVTGGQRVDRGDRLGHIAFGSRTDVLLPAGIGPEDLEVEPGESVTAGETVLVSAEAYERASEAGQRSPSLRVDADD